MGDPLRTGKIYDFDPNIFKKMRPQIVPANKPLVNPLEGLTKDEIIPGLKAKFDDVYRRTPNPMSALFGSPHSYLPNLQSGASNSTTSFSSPLQIVATPISHHNHQTPSSITHPSDQERQPIQQLPQQTPSTHLLSIVEDEHNQEDQIPYDSTPAWESQPLESTNNSSTSTSANTTTFQNTPQRNSTKAIITNPKSEFKGTNESKAATNERQTHSEGKKPRPKGRTQVCDSLSLLFAKPSSIQKKQPQHNLEHVKANDQRQGSEEIIFNLRSKRPKSSGSTSSVQQKLFTSPDKEKAPPLPPPPPPAPTTTTPDKISKRTRSRTQPSQQSILSQLPNTQRDRTTSKSQPIQTKESDLPINRQTNATKKKEQTTTTTSSNKPDNGEKKKNNKLKQNQKPQQSQQPQRSQVQRNQKQKQSKSDNESDSENEQKEDNRQWNKEEILALHQAHRQCPVNAFDFWSLVASQMNEIIEDRYRRDPPRSSEECSDQWYRALNETKNLKKRKTSSESNTNTNTNTKTKTSTKTRSANEETNQQKPKRLTQAKLRVLLEEAFIGEADDIFEHEPLSHPSLSSSSLSTSSSFPFSSSTPHKTPLLSSSSLHSILSVKSPHDLHSSASVTSTSNDANKPQQRRKSESFPESESHWEASYVNKMKKQQKSNKNNNLGRRGGSETGRERDFDSQSTARRQSTENKIKKLKRSNGSLSESSEFQINREGGRSVEAKLDGRGKVIVSVRQREDDDSENEELLTGLLRKSEREETSDEEEEWAG